MTKPDGPPYFQLDGSHPDCMLLSSLRPPSRLESWTLGRPFRKKPDIPVVATIVKGNEQAVLLPFFGTPPIMSREFYEALRACGVDNIEAYDAVIRSEDGNIEHRGFVAINIIGLVRAADLSATAFNPEYPARLFDASINQLAIDSAATRNLLVFRLAEYTGAVFVHRSVKECLEVQGFSGIVFREPKEFVS